VARQLGLGWDAVWGIERRAVARGLERRGSVEVKHVGVDEKSFGCGSFGTSTVSPWLT
jgi:hypothetical protein